MKDVSGKKILIACSMIEDEINAVFDHFDVSDTEIWWEERGHHNDPDKLREVIQTEIDRAEAGGADVIMLAYGLCGKGAVGWHTEHATLAMPRFDDCCNIMLCTGKREKRNHEVDFVVNFPGERVYIQSAYAMETEEKRNQEILPLKKTGDSFKKIIITGDYQDPWKDGSGVIHVGVIPFLLNKEIVER
jgi:hypothetical protein